jgi:predicted permease
VIATTVNALLPVVVTLLLGYLASWHHDVDAKAAGILNIIVLTYALPVSLFVGIMLMSRHALLEQGPLALALLLGLGLPYLATYLGGRLLFRRPRDEAAMQAMGMGVPSVPFSGLPILSAVVGQSAAVVVAICGVISVVLLVPPTVVIVSLAHGGRGANPVSARTTIIRSLRQPLVVAPLLATALVLVGIGIPAPVLGAFTLFAHATGGLALFASGVILQAQKPSFSPAVIFSTLCRTMVIPGLALLALPLLRLDPGMQREIVLALGLPAAAMQIIIAVRYEVAERENASFLLFSNIVAIPTLAFLIAMTAPAHVAGAGLASAGGP